MTKLFPEGKMLISERYFPKLELGNSAGLIHRIFNYSSHRSSRNKSVYLLWRWNIFDLPRKTTSYIKIILRDVNWSCHLFAFKVVKQIPRKIITKPVYTNHIITIKDSYEGLENNFSSNWYTSAYPTYTWSEGHIDLNRCTQTFRFCSTHLQNKLETSSDPWNHC